MKIYQINEQQLQTIANVLGEFPAKQVISVIDMLRSLSPVEESEVEMVSDE